tara:strand:+ start:100 stop:1032 length:933 start_codon:yes stop_codon:yes gene_type:complete
MALNLSTDIQEAKDILEPKGLELRGLLQLWNILTSSDTMCSAFIRDFDNLNYETKLAFTKSIIVDYGKPWSGNRSTAIKSIMVSKQFPFLNPTIAKSNIHNELGELRNKMVAHIDEGYESLGITLRGTTMANINPRRAQDPGTIDELFMPFSVRIESGRGMWWLNDKGKINEISVHIKECIEETGKEISKKATDFRNLCFEHAHVLKSIPDVVSIEEFAPISGTAENPTFNYESSANLGIRFSLTPATAITLGDSNIQSTVGIYEPAPSMPANLVVEGKGYKLTIPEPDENGRVSYNASFPKYPYPKIKP